MSINRRKEIQDYVANENELSNDDNPYHNGPKPWAATELWLLDHEVSYKTHSQGYLLDDRFIITAKGRWRVQGKNKWYWYVKLPALLNKIGVAYNE